MTTSLLTVAGAQATTTVTLTLTSQAAALASFQVSHLPALGQDNYEARP